MNNDTELHRLELAISRFLRWGVATSGLFLAIGWIGQILQSGDVLAHFQEYHPESLALMLEKAWGLRDYPMLIAIGGLGVLVSLPILRVLLTAYLFMRQRDGYLSLMAIFVFCVLLGSFFLGVEI